MTPLLTLIEQIEQRAEKATPGPWSASMGDQHDLSTVNIYVNGWPIRIAQLGRVSLKDEAANATFIAASRTDIPKLIAALRRAHRALNFIDDWQGSKTCNASVYELTDDEFGELQHEVHEAIADIEKIMKG